MAEDWSKYKDTHSGTDWSKYSVTNDKTNDNVSKLTPSDKSTSDSGLDMPVISSGAATSASEARGDTESISAKENASKGNVVDTRSQAQDNIIKSEEHESLLAKGWKLLSHGMTSPLLPERNFGESSTYYPFKSDTPVLGNIGIPSLGNIYDTLQENSSPLNIAASLLPFAHEMGGRLGNIANEVKSPVAERPASLLMKSGEIVQPELPVFRGSEPSVAAEQFPELIKDEAGRVLGSESKLPERPSGPWDSNVGSDGVKSEQLSPEDKLLELAKQRQGMGLSPKEYPQDISVKPGLQLNPRGTTGQTGSIQNGNEINLPSTEGLVKPRLRLNGDNTYTNLDTGEITDFQGNPPKEINDVLDNEAKQALGVKPTEPDTKPIGKYSTREDIENDPNLSEVDRKGILRGWDKVNKPVKADDLLTKLADLSSKTTRMKMGFHIPGTAISFHGINEVLRNTFFDTSFNPLGAAERGIEGSYWLMRPSVPNNYLKINMNEMSNAINNDGLMVRTTDIAPNPIFKGQNLATKGFNYLTDPTPLFGQVIPAMKLKAHQAQKSFFMSKGMTENQAGKASAEVVNNIFAGLNLEALKRNPTTQKVFRAVAMAPDWLESNARLGKGIIDGIRNPTDPKYRAYQVGAVNFLGSYIVANMINAINNNGRFMYQNEPGKEMAMAFGHDSKGRVRYADPYGTAMDMFRIPLSIAHSAITGNIGQSFTEVKNRASLPLQFTNEVGWNRDYSGNPLYGKDKYGRPISPTDQLLNLGQATESNFAPIGIDALSQGIRGKISPEETMSKVLQLPMGYKYPDRRLNQ